MSDLRYSLWLLFGGRKKIEAESKRLTEEHRKRDDERKKRDDERKKLEAQLRQAASLDGDIILIEALLKMGVNVDAQDPETGRTALIIAVDYCCRGVIVDLLSHRADVHIKANNGNSAVDIARAKGQTEIVTLLEKTHQANQDYHRDGTASA
jgi:ankyrin repeat protein